MPRLNQRGQAAMGQAGGPGSVDGRLLLNPGGGLCWLTDDRLLANTGSDQTGWSLMEVPLDGSPPVGIWPGSNALAAGGGRALAWNRLLGVYGSIQRPQGGLRGAGPDGTLAYCRDYQSGRGLVLNAPDGSEVEGPADAYCLDVQVLGPTSALWNNGNDQTEVFGRPPVRPALPSWRLQLVTLNGVDLLVYWSEGTGLIAQVDGETAGWILETRPIAFNHAARRVGDSCVVAWSITSGEGPSDLVRVTVDLAQPKVPLSGPPPAPQPVVFTLKHKVLILPFFAQGSGIPDLFTLGLYTEATALASLPSPLPHGRLLVGHDAPEPWIPPLYLRSWDLPLIEYYRLKSESLTTSAARWLQQTQALLAGWPWDCGVIPQFYGQGGAPPNELWSVGEVLDGLRYLSALVNLSPRIKLIAPFAYARANGITAHPELQQALSDLLAASPGAPVLIPVGGVPAPPQPQPPAPPQPPSPPQPQEPDMIAAYGPPLPGFLPATERDNGNGTISLQKPNGKWLCVNPAGGLEERDTPGGAWESFKRGKNCIVAERDGGAQGPKVYVLMVADL